MKSRGHCLCKRTPPIDEVHWVGALESGKGPQIDVDADIVQRRRISLHDRPTAKVRLYVGVMRRHHGDDGLAQPGGCLRTKIMAHSHSSVHCDCAPA